LTCLNNPISNTIKGPAMSEPVTETKDPCANLEPQKEHLWLQKLVGDWTFEAECQMGPGGETSKSEGTESVRSLGDVWVLCEGRSQLPDGGRGTTLMTLGYDPAKKRFVGSFIASMMTYFWVYDGALDASGKILVLDAVGPSFSGDGKMAQYKDSIEFKDDNHRILSSQVLGDDGQWHRFMTSHYRRKG
jgi:hypothetical protein